MTTCSFCGLSFDDGAAQRACTNCALIGTGCRKVRCPRCAYEMPQEPALIRRFRAWRNQDGKRASQPVG